MSAERIREKDMFEYCLFDLDGTLTDPAEGITKSVQYALRRFGAEEPDLKKLEVFIGPPLKESFMEYYGFSREQTGRDGGGGSGVYRGHGRGAGSVSSG